MFQSKRRNLQGLILTEDDWKTNFLNFTIIPPFTQGLGELLPLSPTKPDFGNIQRSVVDTNHTTGQYYNDYYDAELYREQYLNKIDGFLEEQLVPESSKDDRNTKCRHPAYMTTAFPTCNAIHELRLQSEDGLIVSYLNHGFYRDAFKYHRNESFPNPDLFVMKSMRFRHIIGAETLSKIRKESIILERLSHSPRILDIYSYCGSSVILEAMSSDINKYIVPQKGYMLQSKLDKLQDTDVHPFNQLTESEKLQIALEMAEALADIHGFQEGLIMHADVHIDQWLIAPDGSVKLNDFGDAFPATWNQNKNKYCFRSDLEHSGTWKAPEEYAGLVTDEAIDVYNFGNIIYSLLTGLWPFYDEEYREIDHSIVRRAMIEKYKRPYVDPRYRYRSYIESNLVEIMEKCWAPKESRISIFEVVKMIRDLKTTAWKKGHLQTSNLVKISLPTKLLDKKEESD